MTSLRRQAFASASRRRRADVSRILQATSSPASSSANDPPILILTIGLPGSGKSTFVRALAPQIDAVILESDALRRLLFDEPAYTASESRRLFDALHAAANDLLLAGRNVIIDATSIRESERQPAYRAAEETGARLMLLSFSASQAVIEGRLSRRADTLDASDNSSAGLSIYRSMAARAEPPSRDCWRIDTSDTEKTDAVLSRVVEACRSGSGLLVGGSC